MRTGSRRRKSIPILNSKSASQTVLEKHKDPIGANTVPETTETLTEYVDRKFAEAENRTQEARTKYHELQLNNHYGGIQVKDFGSGT